MTRVYVPSTVEGLAEVAASGALPPGCRAYAATPAVLSELAGCTDEEIEFALATVASEASTQLLLDAARSFGRRVVLVVETAAGSVVTTDDAAGEVAVTSEVTVERIQAILADTDDVPLATDSGPLAWFAVQELADLLA
jgi:hypothetical protein